MGSEGAEAPAAPPAKEPAANPEKTPASDSNTLKDADAQKPLRKARPEREATPADYIRIFKYAKPLDFAILAVASLAAIGTGVTLPVMNIVFGQLIGDFTEYFRPNTTMTQAEFERSLNKLNLYLLILFLARLGCSYFNKFGFRMIGIRISAAIRLHYLTCLFGQTIHVLDSMPSGSAAGAITSTANTLQLGISDKLGTFIEFMATIIGAIIIAFTYSWSLTLVTGSIILFIFLVVSILMPFIIKGMSKISDAEGKASAIANETFSSIRMIMACGAESRITQRYAKWVQEARKRGQMTSPLIALQFGVVFFALFAAFGLAFWYGIKSYLEGRVGGVGPIFIVLMSVMIAVISLERISTPLLAASKAMVAACEFFTVIDAPRPEVKDLKAPDVSASEDIIFSDVHFAYPSRPHVKVLDGLDLTIEAGKLTAIVGPSGSGKSTIVGLIERWYALHEQYVIEKTIQKDAKEKREEKKKAKKEKKKKAKAGEKEAEPEPEASPFAEENQEPVELKGTIMTSGHNLDDINLHWWRSQIGLVQQEPFLFNDTIYKNVAYGLIGSEWENESEERKRELVKEACKEAFADEFIDRLPDGYETMVGESGTKLSGGQRQRIAIARSIIKKPKILILDEATSAIDVRGERIVQAALDKVSQGRTTITIAHRLSTIKKADRIVVLQKGRVVETGTHESLLAKGEGVYYGLVHAQQLSLGEPHDEGDGDITEEEDIAAILSREKSAAKSDAQSVKETTKWKAVGLINGFGRLLYEQKSRMPSYIATIFFAMCAAAGSPVQAYLFAKIIVVFNADTPEQMRRDSEFWSLMWVVLAAAVGLSYFALGFVSTHLAHYIAATYRQQYFESILFQKTAYFDNEDHSVGTLTSRVAGDPKQLEEMLGMNMAMVYTSVFTLIGSFAIAFVYSWKLSLVALFVTAPLGLGAGYFRFRFEMNFEQMYAAVFAESSKFAAEAIGAFRTVTSLTLEPVIIERYNRLLHSHVISAYKKARWTSVIFALSDSLSIACQALIFWYGGRLLATRELDILNFFICFMAVIQGAESAGNGLSFGPNMAQAASASDRILSTRETRNRDEISKSEKIPDVDGGIRIELQDVHFRYPTRNMSVFKGLNLTIEKGQFAALVGASGCGKTSIISLLERFYDVESGRILCNGRDITEVNLYEYRNYLSLVAQEPTLFQGTVRDNILLGVDPETVTEERLHEVCREASIHDFIVSLPDGYNTDVGSKGFSLSGGQKQRIAIARALIRNPRVLLLDEATSSLDSESEKLVQAAFERAAAGRTMVVVAHRLATVQNADIIFVLGEGKVLEKGSHAELLKKRGVYWHMCMSQALDR